MIEGGGYWPVFDIIARHGLAAVADGRPMRVLLVHQNFHYQAADRFVSDVADDEIDLGGYERQDVTGVRFADDDVHGPRLIADGPVNFGAIEAGDRLAAAIVFHPAARDEDAELVACVPFADDERGRPPATAGGPVTLDWSPRGLLTLRPEDVSSAPTARGLNTSRVYAERRERNGRTR